MTKSSKAIRAIFSLKIPLAIVAIWAVWVFLVLLHGNGVNWAGLLGLENFDYETAAQFGDSFGSLSAFMASLAAAGAWIAVGQTREQAFEATVYNLLGQLTQIVAGTDIQGKKNVVGSDGKRTKKNTDKFEGKDAFGRMLRNLRLSVAGTKGVSQEDRVIKGFRSFHDKYQNDLAHYFRTVYHIVRYVHFSNSSNKQLFISILRAQMRDAEQTLLMYNCSVGKGREKFKDLVEKHSLLHNCSRNKKSGHWENTLLRPAFKSTAFRDDKIEVWPSADDLRFDIEKSTTTKIEG
ncbi:MAG: putative phage abortive infection protein [Sphingomonadales bacterium]|jgi:hypothetical protein